MSDQNNSPGVKMYASAKALGVTDIEVITEYKSLMSNAPLFGDTEDFKQAFREFCDKVRSIVDIQNVISFNLANGPEDDEVLLVLIYNAIPSPGRMFQQGYDEKGYYMIMTEG